MLISKHIYNKHQSSFARFTDIKTSLPALTQTSRQSDLYLNSMLIFSLGSLAWLSAFKTSHFKAEITSIKRSQTGSREQLVHPAMAHIPSSPFNAFHHIQLISRLETDFTHVLKQMSEFKCSCVLILTLETRPVVLTDWTGRRTVATGTSLLFSVDLTFDPDALTSRKTGAALLLKSRFAPFNRQISLNNEDALSADGSWS